ncbi:MULTISPECIES: hypothetical protein [Nocardioides]|uniref:Translation initiation factor IF-2 n=1 Tax=Nocardioides vastitatis TaxID=2568655 RepID=A0ABW0ZCF6_9ACTN|nr:hypothetical protein [Nocardioides sp.]THJ05323.1 hypothetical protein E7Z54_07495 [Nocardioides sp.]
MTSQHRIERLRVDAPTLEPDSALLGMLADLSASSRPATPRTARSTGLRIIASTASVAVIAAATWAAGIQIGAETPLSPADRPSQQEISGQPSPGDVGTPHPDVSAPGSPPSPGLPGTSATAAERAVDLAEPEPPAETPRRAAKSTTTNGKLTANPGKGRRAGQPTEHGAGFGYPPPTRHPQGLGTPRRVRPHDQSAAPRSSVSRGADARRGDNPGRRGWGKRNR